jgi:hypothetical protein
VEIYEFAWTGATKGKIAHATYYRRARMDGFDDEADQFWSAAEQAPK